jgi:protein SCO1/2
MSLRLLGATLLLVIGLGSGVAGAEEFKGGAFDPPHAAPDFELRGSDGAPATLARFKGKIVVVAFGFSYCQKVCPVTLAKLSQVFKELGPAGKDVQVLFITVDPERDSPERLKEFVTFFNPGFIGATGTPEQLEKTRQDYGVVATRVASENKKLGYEVHHSSSLFVIDRAGKVRVLEPFGGTAADVVHDLKLLLAS